MPVRACTHMGEKGRERKREKERERERERQRERTELPLSVSFGFQSGEIFRFFFVLGGPKEIEMMMLQMFSSLFVSSFGIPIYE